MESPSDQVVCGHQRARLLELEERQREIKRLCEEALREEEQHIQIFQHLEEHNTGAASSVVSLGGGGAGSVSGAAGLHLRLVSPRVEAEPLDDLLTGEVQSFRDPNSIARASSTGSAAAVPRLRGLSSSNPRNASVDRPYTRLGSSYRPPTHPLPTVSTAQPPPPPRAMLYSTPCYPREGNRAASAAANRSIQPPALSPATSSSLQVTDAWWRGEKSAPERQSGSHAAVAAFSALAAPAPLSPPPPPPPERSRSRSASYSAPQADPCRRSDARLHYSVLPPPPPPPASNATRATPSPFSVRYSRALGARAGLSPPFDDSSPPPPLPSRSSAPPLVSPDEVTDNLPPPPPRTHRHAVAKRDVKPTIANMCRRPHNFFIIDSPLPPSPSRAYTDLDDHSVLSTTSSVHDIARWSRRLSGSAALEERDGHSAGSGRDRSKAAAQQPFTTRPGTRVDIRLGEWCTPPASATPRLSVPYRETATRRGVEVARQAPRSSPPPPPTVSGATLLSSLARYSESTDEGESLPNRWETASLTPSLRSAEERRLHTYFSKPDGVVGSSTVFRKNYTSYNRQRVPTYHSGVKSAQATLLAADDTAPFTSAPTAARFEGSTSAWQPASGTEELPLQQSSTAVPPPTYLASSAPTATDAPPPAPSKSKSKKTTLHPYGPEQAQSASLSPPPEPGLKNAAARNGCDAPEHTRGAPSPPFSTLYVKHQRTIPSASYSSRHDSNRGRSAISPPAQLGVSGAASTPAPHTAVAASVSDYFDMGPEKEALLSLLQESTRRAPGSSVGVALPTPSHTPSIQPEVTSAALANISGGDQHGEKAHPYPPSLSRLFERNQAQNVDTSPMTTTLPPYYDDPETQHSYFNSSAGTSFRPGGSIKTTTVGVPRENEVTAAQLQQKYNEARSKAEALARHLVKAIGDRKMLQDNVEQLEVLLEECNAEVGRLQHIAEEQHQDSVTSLGVQAALRAKEREVAVYEDEIRRLNAVLNGHLTRTASAERAAQENVRHGMVVMGAEVEAAMKEVGMAHLAQREAEERATQLASELNTAVEQIQFLDERLAEMERAAAAARFQRMHTRISEEDGVDLTDSNAAAAHFAIPPDEETRRWPPEARRAMAQLVAQAEGLLLQNAEGERHASMRLQHMENACSQLQQHLRQRGEEADRAREACAQLRQEKSALQTVGNLWYQQLREVKEDAQLVSEMVRTAREDAEDVYLSSRAAEECAAAAARCAAAASPLQPLPAPAPTNPATLKKAAQFAQQVMRDFHAVARFLSSLRTMNIGDRNGYQILQAIASGHHPSEGLYVTSDDADTPMRLRELLPPNAASEVKRRVQEKKARVLRAVEQALIIDPVSTAASASPDRPENRPSRHAPIMLGLPPRTGEPPPPAELEEYEVPDALEDDTVDDYEAEVEVVSSSLHPVRMSSQALRDGSSGMVHSDMRQCPASDSVTVSSHNRVPPTAPTSQGRYAPPALAASLSPAPFVPDDKPSCSTLCMEGCEAPTIASTSRPTTAKAAPAPLTPLPSVSRPLRLSATPSQPQSEGKEEDEDEVVIPSDKQSIPTRASLHTVLTADSMHIQGNGAGVDADMSSVTLVSSPSMLQQSSQQQTETVQQAPSLSSALAVTATPPVDHVTEANRSIMPSLSDIALADHNEGASAARRLASVQLQVQAEQKDNSIPATRTDIAPPPSRLRSPTPDRMHTVWAEMRADVTLVTSPLEQPRPSQLFADEPLPRVVLDGNKHPVHLGSQPKDRSTTARPSSTPHPDSRSGTRRGGEAGGGEEIVAPSLHTGRHCSCASNESNDDEATLFFREPPRGEVQEVAAESTPIPLQQCLTHGEVDLLSDEFAMPCRRSSAAAVLLAPAPCVSPQNTSVLDREAEVERQVPSAVPAAIPPSLHPKLPLKGDHAAASSMPPKVSTAKKQSLSRGHRAVDDDDEPSLSFSAVPPPPPPSKEHAKGDSEGNALARALSAEAPLSDTGQSRTIENTGGAADLIENAPHSPSSLSRGFPGAPLRALHQPRRSAASDGCPSLAAAADTVAPPRLQRSAGSSQWTGFQPHRGIVTPETEVTAGPAAGAGQHSRRSSQSPTASVSLDRPLPEVPSTLVEPRRPSPSTRPVPASARTSSVTPGDSAISSSTKTEGSSTAQTTSAVPGREETLLAQLGVVIHVDDPLRSGGKLSTNIVSSTPESRLPSISSTAAPSSPLRCLEELSGGLNLPDEMHNTLAHEDSVVPLLVEPLQAPRGRSHELSARAGNSAAPRLSPNEGAAPAPLPTANVDALESNTLNLRRASPGPSPSIAEATTSDGNRSSSSPVAAQAPSSTISTPRSGSGCREGPTSVWSSIPTEQPMSDEAAAKRREDVARILKRIKMKKGQGQKACSETDTPTSPTASELSSARLEDVDTP